MDLEEKDLLPIVIALSAYLATIRIFGLQKADDVEHAGDASPVYDIKSAKGSTSWTAMPRSNSEGGVARAKRIRDQVGLLAIPDFFLVTSGLILTCRLCTPVLRPFLTCAHNEALDCWKVIAYLLFLVAANALAALHVGSWRKAIRRCCRKAASASSTSENSRAALHVELMAIAFLLLLALSIMAIRCWFPDAAHLRGASVRDNTSTRSVPADTLMAVHSSLKPHLQLSPMLAQPCAPALRVRRPRRNDKLAVAWGAPIGAQRSEQPEPFGVHGASNGLA